MRQHTAPQAQVYRAKLALLLHAEPTLDNPSAARRLGKHENWVRYWRRIWATEGFRLADKAGTRAQARFPPRWPWPRSRRWPANCRAQRGEPLSRYSTAEIARLIAAHAGRPGR